MMRRKIQAPVVQTLDSAIHWINLYPLDNSIGFASVSAGYPSFEQLGPGPTIFEVIDSTRTVCADYNQGNEVLFGENAGKQCVAMSLTAIIYHHIEDILIYGVLPL